MDVLHVRFPTSRELDDSDAMDANQCWDLSTAPEWMHALAPFNPYWFEEPTSPDDVLAHRAIARQIAPDQVASNERVQNRVVFEQLLQARRSCVMVRSGEERNRE